MIIRRVLLFLLSIILISGGIYVMMANLHCMLPPFARGCQYFYLRGLFASLVLEILGAYLLWDDFVRPLLPKKTKIKN